MTAPKTIYVMADAHLGAAAGDLDRFLAWAKTLPPLQSEFLFLGDLFHVWAGPKAYHTPLVTRLMEFLTRFHGQGGGSRLVVGNRDVFFRFGKGFPMAELPFAEIAPDFLTLQLKGVKVLATHGDLVNRHDHAYLRWRRWVRSWWFQAAFGLLPSSQVKTLMLHLEAAIKQTNQEFRLAFPEEEWITFLKQTQEAMGFDLLLAGHFHPKDLIETPLPQGKGLVLPDWMQSGTLLTLKENGSYELLQIP